MINNKKTKVQHMQIMSHTETETWSHILWFNYEFGARTCIATATNAFLIVKTGVMHNL